MKEDNKFKESKRRLKEQERNDFENKKFKRELDATVEINANLSSLKVFSNVQKEYEKSESKLFKLRKEYKIAKEKKLSDKDLEQIKNKYNAAKIEFKSAKQKHRAEVKKIIKLNAKPKGLNKGKAPENVAISVKGVKKVYASKGIIFQALKGVNVDFEKGSINVILGESGSGKTTLLNMISGLDRATSGEVIIDNINLQALTTRQITQFRREKIGFVFQSYNLLPSLNVSDNVEVGRSLQTNKALRKDINSLLESMEMGNNNKKMTYELSGGQQQRVSIARALSKSPEILIGDEPTGALDHVTTGKVLDLLQRINRENKTTIIIVTHNPDVAKLAHKVIEVRDGNIKSITENRKPARALDIFN